MIIIIYHLSWLAHIDGVLFQIKFKVCRISMYTSQTCMRISNHPVCCASNLPNYCTVYEYIRKSNKFLLHSDEHPGLWAIDSPKSKPCIRSYQGKHKLNKTMISRKSKNKVKYTDFATLLCVNLCQKKISISL